MHRAWFTGLPVVPSEGDKGAVKEAVADIVDAAAGLEHSRAQFRRAIAVAQEEFNTARDALPDLAHADVWGGRNVPAVYYEFYNTVAWTRAVKDRYHERLHPAVKHDPELWKRLQKIRSKADDAFEDARLLAKCSLHKFTPPHTLAGPKAVKDGSLIYRIPEVIDADDFRVNLGTISDARHVESIVVEFWSAVSRFVDELLDVFYPGAAKGSA
jgi:hypothetical protein